jgi:hypothetical protein
MNLRRISLVAALALALPVVASAQSRTATSTFDSGFNAGVLLGMESGDGDSGLSLRVDGVWDTKRIAPKVLLSGVLSVGFSHFGNNGYNPALGYNWSFSDSVFRLIPAARFTFDVAPKFSLYTDAGLGLYIDSRSATQWDYTYNQPMSYGDTVAGVAMRFAGGAVFDVSRSVRLGGEIGLNPYFGNYDRTTLSLMALAQFRM